MDYTLFSDLGALCILLVVLFFLRCRHPEERVDLWFAGLLLILVEGIAHIAYQVPGPWHTASHVIALNCFAVAGSIFIFASLRNSLPSRLLVRMLVLNSIPRLVALTMYGMHVRNHEPYYIAAFCGVAVSVATSFFHPRWPLVAAGYLGAWALFVVSVSNGNLRFATYWLLTCLFLATAFCFFHSLPSSSIGRLVIVTGFTLWAGSFLIHSWAATHSAIAGVADDIWNFQKFLVVIGMLIVMLENQVSRNAALALHDPLTGLPNRRLFDDRLAHALRGGYRTATRVALILMDLDNFKGINDSCGHHCGDKVLQQLSEQLRRNVRNADTLARIGGDEFALIVSDVSATEPILESLRRSLAEPVSVADRTFHVTASFGVAVCPDDAEGAEELREIADGRMYESKRESAHRATREQQWEPPTLNDAVQVTDTGLRFDV